MWKITRFNAVNAVSSGLSSPKRNTWHNTVRAAVLNLLNKSNMLAKLVFRGMAILTVTIGLLLVGFCFCLVTGVVVILIVLLRLTLSVAARRIEQIIKKGKKWLRIF